jgi:hypothetical protein
MRQMKFFRLHRDVKQLATHLRMNSAPLGSSDNLEERDFCGVAINSETWETLNLDGTKTHFEFELIRKM